MIAWILLAFVSIGLLLMGVVMAIGNWAHKNNLRVYVMDGNLMTESKELKDKILNT